MFWNTKPKKETIMRALSTINDPASGHDIVALGWVGGIGIQDREVTVALEVDPSRQKELEILRNEAQTLLQTLKGVKMARVILTAEKAQPANLPKNAASPIKTTTPQRDVAPDVKRIIAVASGKGGVGKSTIAVNLAIALQQSGLKVGLLDADVYGPSVPMLTGLRTQKPVRGKDDYLLPLEAHGLKIMSMGFLVAEEAPMVWRGPMVQSALLQMLRDVQWGALDVLIIDMPPGTGDTQLTIAQRVKLAGAVIVSTPQDIALMDTVKGVEMFRKVAVPILGIIENMSFFTCPQCNHVSHVFGHHGARNRASEIGVDFLGEIPIDMDVRIHSDNGRPVTLQQDHPVSGLFKEIAKQVMMKLDTNTDKKPAPRIIIEPAA